MKTTIMVKGMHCKSCEMLIKDSVEELKGVSNVDASFKTGKVNVDYDSKKVDIEKIKQTICSEGYKTQ